MLIHFFAEIFSVVSGLDEVHHLKDSSRRVMAIQFLLLKNTFHPTAFVLKGPLSGYKFLGLHFSSLLLLLFCKMLLFLFSFMCFMKILMPI